MSTTPSTMATEVLLHYVVRHRHTRQSTPLRGVGGAFIVMAIAVCTLLLLHGMLFSVGHRIHDILQVVDSEADYSDVFFTTTGADAGSDDASNASSFRGFGKRLRKSLSFKLPNGSWHHSSH